MYIAQQLKKNNISEYLLYMWQVEDIIRANGMDIDRLEEDYLSKFKCDKDKAAELRQWYSDITDMMRSEGVAESGHIQINKNVIILLTDLHNRLLKSPKYPFYTAAYYKALPFIVELRNRGESKDKSEVENCMDAMYGLMMLRLKGKPISDDTQTAMGHIAKLLGLLSEYYKKDNDGELEF